MPTTPPTITALPTPPSRSDSANFAARGDAFMASLPTFRSETNSVAGNVYANAVEADADAAAANASAVIAAAQASAAANSAAAAAASVGAPQWVSGTTYTAGQVVWSPSTYLTYRRKTTGAGTTDPALDLANWASQLPPGSPTLSIVTGTSQAATANNHYVLTNVAATTVTLPAMPTAGDLVWVTVGNGLTTNVVARNGSNIQSLAEDLTLNATYAAVQMRYINSTIGWTFV